jgi:competence protein ComEA
MSQPQPSVHSAEKSVGNYDVSSESFFRKLRLVLWAPHQRYVALILLAGLISMMAFFAHRAYVNRGLIEIEDSRPLQAEFKVDINQAEWAEIVILPGVGVKLAQAIVQHRREAGPFNSPESLMDVPGIGQKKMELLRPYLLPLPPRN